MAIPEDPLKNPQPAPGAETTFIPSLGSTPLPSRYERLSELGRGGMGIVYKARDRETGEVVAVKVLKPEIASDTQILERFKNELRLAHRITHRNVARLYEFHRSADGVYLSMEFVEGESLRSLLEREGKLDLDRALRLARQLADGLGEAHRQSIVHRDLKPENIMLGPGDELKIMDFGISRSYAEDVTATASIIGTPAYMAPEQAEGRPADQRTDVYATGLILYEMLTGTAAFTGDTAMTVALKQIRERPAPPRALAPALPRHIDSAIMRALEKDPAARFPSVEALMQALEDAQPALATKPNRPPRRWPLAAAGLALALLVAAVSWWRIRPSDSIHFPLEQFTLANGLKVALSPDHASPTFTLAVAYRAGWRQDAPCQQGLAHLLEHTMFEGSANVARGEYADLINGAGGNLNGQVNQDLAFFWQTLPANQLELALFLEADRIQSLEVTPEGLQAARAAIAQETAQILADPLNRAFYHTYPLAFDNPLNEHTPADAQGNARTMDEVVRFYRTYYVPSNAGLVLIGDFDPRRARERIRHYFESIPAHPAPPVPDTREPGRSGEKREVVHDAALPTQSLILAWRAPAANRPDWFPLKRAADVLGGGSAGRLQTALVRDAGVASSLYARLDDSAGPNLLVVLISLTPGKQPSQAESLVDAEIDRIAREGVPKDELQRWQTDALRSRAFEYITPWKRAIHFARLLTSYGDAQLANTWEQSERRVSSDDVRRAAQEYLKPANRTVVVATPAPGVKP